MTGLPHIPVLRRGRPHASLERQRITDPGTGEALADIGFAPAALIRRDAQQLLAARDKFHAMSPREAEEMCDRAAGIFLEGSVPFGDAEHAQSADEFVRVTSATTGMPHGGVRMGMERVAAALAGTGPEGINVPLPEPSADALGLGVVLPSNAPGVNLLWVSALRARLPVTLKPGRHDPWTPWRILGSLLEAGCPPSALSFYPTDHEGTHAVLRSGHGLLFGDEATVARYRDDPTVEIRGPGRSAVVLGPDLTSNWENHLPALAEAVTGGGGRSCLNASTIVVTGTNGDAVAEGLAARLAPIEPRTPEDPDAVLCSFPDPSVAGAVDRALDEALDSPGVLDVSANHRSGPRRVEESGRTYLLPTVIRCGPTHPLARRELPFPFASVVDADPAAARVLVQDALSLTILSEDADFRASLSRT